MESIAVSSGTQASSREEPAHSSFAAFMMQRRQIGRVTVPTFVAILAAIIFTAGAAYALVKAYEAFVLPTMQQQEQPVAKKSKSAKKESAATRNKKAHKAYKGVIARYEDFANYCEKQGAGASYDGWAQGKGDGSGLGQLFVYDNQTAPESFDYYYALEDLNDDGVDELLIGCVDTNNNRSSVIGAYSFVKGDAVSVVPSSEVEEGSGDMRNQYDGFIVQGEGQSFGLCKDSLIKFECEQDTDKAELYFKLDENGSKLEDAIQMTCADSDPQNGSYVIRTVEDSNKAQEKTVQGRDEAMKVFEEFEKKHPSTDMEMPSSDSKEWTLFKSAAISEDAVGDTPDGQSTSESTDSPAPAESSEESSDEQGDDDGGAEIPDMNSFIATAKRELRVPDDPSITYTVSDRPSYWEGAGVYVWDVQFYKNGQSVAGAECGSNGYPNRSIMSYHEN